MRLDDLNALPRDAAEREFLRCCGSTRWARLMTDARPFSSVDDLAAAADRLWWQVDPADWREAFAAHPRIGDREAGRAGGSGRSGGWAAQEQSGVTSAPADVLERLARGNAEYDARFGYIFIVCGTGKTAAEMVALLQQG